MMTLNHFVLPGNLFPLKFDSIIRAANLTSTWFDSVGFYSADRPKFSKRMVHYTNGIEKLDKQKHIFLFSLCWLCIPFLMIHHHNNKNIIITIFQVYNMMVTVQNWIREVNNFYFSFFSFIFRWHEGSTPRLCISSSFIVGRYPNKALYLLPNYIVFHEIFLKIMHWFSLTLLCDSQYHKKERANRMCFIVCNGPNGVILSELNSHAIFYRQ